MAFSDITGKVKSTRPALPQIYAYTTPEIRRHDGWTKIGYTEQDVNVRIAQQTHTADVIAKLEWHGNATYEDTGEVFHDTDFHTYLRHLGINDQPGTEWFEINPPNAKGRFHEFRENHGILDGLGASDYELRAEQEAAISKTLDYFQLHEQGEFLWNAKPRFGKTLATYDLCKRLPTPGKDGKAKRILVVTNRPAIANSWYDDYVKFVGTDSGWRFISSVDALAGKPYCISHDEYLHLAGKGKLPNSIEFISLQDLKGSIEFGGHYDKLKYVAEYEYDLLVIDEAHEGVDTYKTDVAFDHIKRRNTLHLSGTPFKAIANDKFPEDAIYNWTYADEQQAKRDWKDPERRNPYENLPKLNMFTYQMSDIIEDEVAQGMQIDGVQTEYAFDLNEFFETKDGRFVHHDDVKRFLDALTTQKKYPFSTPELRDELRHTFWMLNRVDSARALARMLRQHEVFKDYEIILAAGDGKIDDDEENEKSFDKVRNAIAKAEKGGEGVKTKTITLSVGQLTTGVTVPEWTGVLMLSNMKSPALYVQAAFRAQNPCLFNRNGKYLRKENAYVFDFDPARSLTVFEEYANDLYSGTACGGGDTDSRKQNVRRLLNFFPVIGEDEDGEMVELDAEQVLSIPRRIHSREVVRRGFMCDFLFQNISNIFHAPTEVIETLQQLEPYKAPKEDLGVKAGTADELDLDENGEVSIPDEQVIGKSKDLFGDKVYGDIDDELNSVIDSIVSKKPENPEENFLANLQKAVSASVAEPLVEAAKQNYGSDMKASQQKKVERKIKADVNNRINREYGDYNIEKNRIERDRAQALENAESQAEENQINQAHDERIEAARLNLIDNLKQSRSEMVQSAGETVVREIETAKKEAQKNSIENGIRDHLRGFSRTIPSFLMAYGDENTTLESFDSIIPDRVFKDVTSITVDQFRLLRDGGDVTDHETGEKEHFDGHLFDPVVFNDSVLEFIHLRGKLADYFDESHKEDIFDYVPPQKTNQIFTPRKVVVEMVDMLEQENPGCFDDPTHTFADLYMKSGMYITEIIKRLYNSKAMRRYFPDDHIRLAHILEHQVYGIAPTEIIYQIATHYILGYDNELGKGLHTHFAMADSAQLAKEGKLAEFVDKAFEE
ncbi:DEAD/DEAH box helicase family protein [Bifidobacterium adolescentis]|uniref:DEAD/DEAH box helicase family protein n=1 Tax=Bifidobacterium adolescentis TaxID=1680 RepID=UPI00165D8B71|nr:DEAD/DEAH box helicase family protein [Bifidobacterium adolescentis]MBC9858160.1 type II restriction endonuclease [Bifidobacterium adolescentis]